jgi:hypothetical protein
MKIAIIGAGHVAGSLAKQWAGQGHDIVFGVRDPKNPKVHDLLDSIGAHARAEDVAEAAAVGEVVVLATPWSAAQDAIRAAGDISGKILIDCTNPLLPDVSGLSIGRTTSAAEEIAGWASGARVVKAFNTIGAERMLHPQFGSQAASLFICGDDEMAKSVVAGLAEEIGFDVIDAGPLTVARLLEPLAMLWIHLAYKQGLGPNIAFKLLRA